MGAWSLYVDKDVVLERVPNTRGGGGVCVGVHVSWYYRLGIPFTHMFRMGSF